MALREFQRNSPLKRLANSTWAACRWPDWLVCPRCRNGRAYELVERKRWQATGCRQRFADRGEKLKKTKTPLTVWFWAAYLMTTDKRGVSALLLQRQLALSRYETAWMMRHKLRRAMVKLAREALRGEVEVDEGVRRPVCREAGNSRAAQRPWSWRPWRNAAVRPDACGSPSARISQARP